MANYIYVLDKNGNPLMPTIRHSKIRRLLKKKQAKIVDYHPFTIQLLYEPKTKEKGELIISIDPGRTNIGVVVQNKEAKIYMAVKVETCNKQIPKLMKKRKQHRQASRRGERKRRQRRAKKNNTTFKNCDKKEKILPGCKEPIIVNIINNTEAKYCNRQRAKGWLTPTATQLLRTHINIVKKLSKYLPITHCVLEYNAFAFMAIENPFIKTWEYSKGTLYKEEDMHSYISKTQNNKCLFCKSNIEHYHHIVPLSKNGSNTVNNIVGLCEKHHTLVHTTKEWEEKLNAKKEGLQKQYGALSVLNQIMPYLFKELENMFKDNFYMCDGFITKAIREKYHLDKDHHIDAYCIGLSYLETLNTNLQIEKNIHYYEIKQYRRHNRQIIHRQTERTYKLNGKVIAKNRKKHMEQKTDSLHEWYIQTKNELGKEETKKLQSQLRVLKSTRSYRNAHCLLPGTVFLYKKKRYILSGTTNEGRYYRALNEGTKNFKANDCKIITKNQGLVFI